MFSNTNKMKHAVITMACLRTSPQPQTTYVPSAANMPCSEAHGLLGLEKVTKGGGQPEKERGKLTHCVDHAPQLRHVSKEKLHRTQNCCDWVLFPITTAPCSRKNTLLRGR